MSVKQDMQVRTVDVVRYNIGSGQAATCSIANAALDPSNANLFVHETSQQKMISRQGQNHCTVFPVFMSCKDSRIDNLRVARKANGYHPLAAVH
jgi:hypothetical protein